MEAEAEPRTRFPSPACGEAVLAEAIAERDGRATRKEPSPASSRYALVSHPPPQAGRKEE